MVIKNLSNIFNWLGQYPKRQYVLGELAEKITNNPIQLAPLAPLSRAGRLTERGITLTSFLIAAVVTGGSIGPMLLAGAFIAASGKVTGLVAGAIAHGVVNDYRHKHHTLN